MRVDVFDFELPPELIALEPVVPRDASRLLHITRDEFHDRKITDLPEQIRPGDLLVTNDTKVIPAQLFGARASREEAGAPVAIEATLHKDLGGDTWRAFVRPAKRLREGDVVRFGESLTATVRARDGAEAVLQFDAGAQSFSEALAQTGVTPLPPYIARRRAADKTDIANYQTIFADDEGSVAAPTAGLHFTDDLLDRIKAAGAGHLSITLHVGAGTFLPVSVDDTDQHIMHSEWGEITEDQAGAINAARAAGGRIIAVGTTALRLLESAANADGRVQAFRGETDIFITPGYRFRAVDLLLTNFHLPRSTLFMLVCAFSGTDRMQAAYAHAREQFYRFYSYGDACLLEKSE